MRIFADQLYLLLQPRNRTWRVVIGAWLLLSLVFGPIQAAHSPQQADPPATHTVQAGETLSEIAQAYGVTPAEVMAINGIGNADSIYVGQELILPPGASLIGQPDLVPTHTVKAGETLSQIAEQYGLSPTRLMYMNGIRNPNTIFVGQVLRLPADVLTTVTPQATAARSTSATPSPSPTQTATATSTSTPTATATLGERPTSHVVKAGENLTQIAQRYDVAVADLLRLNAIRDSDTIYVGQVLKIPGGEEATATPTSTARPSATATVTPSDTPAPTATAETIPNTTPPMATETPAAPAAAEATPTVTASPTLPPEPLVQTVDERIASLNRSYTVRPGDTLTQIARRQGVDEEALRRLNRLDAGVGLVSGATLLLPATADELRATAPQQDYTVQPGDSLGQIAQRFDVTLADLLAVNYIVNPDNLTIGQQLAIPGQKLAESGQKERQQVGPLRRGFYYYTVQSGDTLSGLAEQFNSAPLAILDYNGLPNEETVFRGLEIRIPYGPPGLPVRLPPVPASGTSFMVSLSRQECWVYTGIQVLYTWDCSTGYGEWVTRTGKFAVQSKIENAKSRAYQLDMPYWLGIYNVGNYENGIHGLPVDWDTGEKIWEGLIGTPATFGCAMLSDENAKTLFDLAYIGMPVYIIR